MSVIVTGFKVKRRIADGGFSSVWEATRVHDKQLVALKVITEQGMRESWIRKSFVHEGKILLGLKHDYVVQIHDYTTEAVRPTIVMEYFPSENLKRCILKVTERFRDRAPQLMVKLCQGLDYLHQEGIIHRDIKPENVLLDEAGVVKLIDFSLAIDTRRWSSMFRSRRIQGTPLYMAPEQIRNKNLDKRCDIYALGCVFFEMLTRKPPFVASSQEKILIAHCKEKPVSPLRWQKNIPNKVCKIVLAMLKKKADKRPTLDEVIAQLDGVEMVLEHEKAK